MLYVEARSDDSFLLIMRDAFSGEKQFEQENYPIIMTEINLKREFKLFVRVIRTDSFEYSNLIKIKFEICTLHLTQFIILCTQLAFMI